MTLTGEPVAFHSDYSRSAPFEISFGFAVIISSALGAAFPAIPTLTTTVPKSSSNLSAGYCRGFEWKKLVSSEPGRDLPHLESSSPSQQISTIRAMSGLTTDQIGRLFGVSRRSIHNWINGNAMAPHHEERAAEILSIVCDLEGSTPAGRRATLLDSSDGRSLFHKLATQTSEGAKLQFAGASPRERLGQ